MPDDQLSHSELVALLDYDPKTGVLTRKEGPRVRGWRPKIAGPVANKPDNGRLRIGIHGKRYLVHRVVWFLIHGAWPSKHIDHINGDPQDNRISNLRDVPNKENCRNQKVRKNNRTGTTGVYWRKDHQVWTAQIHVNGKREHLGFFTNKEDATAARREAERRHGYHPNHGTR